MVKDMTDEELLQAIELTSSGPTLAASAGAGEGDAMTAAQHGALLDDDELIDRIEETYGPPGHFSPDEADIAELVRRYRAATRPYAQAYRPWEPREPPVTAQPTQPGAATGDDELLDCLPFGGAVGELVRRYRDARFRLSRIATEASFQAPPATQVAPAPEKPVAAQLRGGTGPTTAADVLELCQRVLDGPDGPARYEDVRTMAEWVLTRMKVEKALTRGVAGL